MDDRTIPAHLSRMHQVDIYKTKFVAFVDLLGFHSTIEKSAERADLQRSVADIIGTFQKTACENEAHDIRLTGFSDSLVMSAEVTPEGLNGLLMMIRHIACNLIQKDILIRGGISLGLIHHEGTMTFGPALNEAYGIENQWAVYPTVIVSNAVAAKAAEFESTQVCADPHRPHLMMLDYLLPFRAYTGEPVVGGIVLDGPARLIVGHIQKRLLEHASNPSLFAKARWIEAYWNSVVRDHGILPTTAAPIDPASGFAASQRTIMVELEGKRRPMTVSHQSLPRGTV